MKSRKIIDRAAITATDSYFTYPRNKDVKLCEVAEDDHAKTPGDFEIDTVRESNCIFNSVEKYTEEQTIQTYMGKLYQMMISSNQEDRIKARNEIVRLAIPGKIGVNRFLALFLYCYKSKKVVDVIRTHASKIREAAIQLKNAKRPKQCKEIFEALPEGLNFNSCAVIQKSVAKEQKPVLTGGCVESLKLEDEKSTVMDTIPNLPVLSSQSFLTKRKTPVEQEPSLPQQIHAEKRENFKRRRTSTSNFSVPPIFVHRPLPGITTVSVPVQYSVATPQPFPEGNKLPVLTQPIFVHRPLPGITTVSVPVQYSVATSQPFPKCNKLSVSTQSFFHSAPRSDSVVPLNVANTSKKTSSPNTTLKSNSDTTQTDQAAAASPMRK